MDPQTAVAQAEALLKQTGRLDDYTIAGCATDQQDRSTAKAMLAVKAGVDGADGRAGLHVAQRAGLS